VVKTICCCRLQFGTCFLIIPELRSYIILYVGVLIYKSIHPKRIPQFCIFHFKFYTSYAIMPPMKDSLAHLPQDKRGQLAHIVERIRKRVDSIQMIILFGSYARGNWVEDTCKKGHITYEYISDFDILAIVETNKIANSTNLWPIRSQRNNWNTSPNE